MKKIMLVIIIMFFISLASAQLIFQQNTPIDLKIPCSIGGNICSAIAECNITIRYPNTTYMYSNQQMQNQNNGDFNLTFSDSTIAGLYTARAVCIDGGYNGTSVFEFEINKAGRTLQTSQGILYTITIIVSMIIFGLCLWAALKLPYGHQRDLEGTIIGVNDLKFVKIIMWFFTYLSLIWITYMLKIVTGNFLYSNVAEKFFNIIFWFLVAFLFPIAVITVVVIIMTVLQNKQLESWIKRGVRVK